MKPEPPIAAPERSHSMQKGVWEESEPAAAPSIRFGLWSTLAEGARLSWERIGCVLSVSLLGVAGVVLTLSMGLLIPPAVPGPIRTLWVALVSVLLLSPLAAAGFALADRAANRREITPRSLVDGFKNYGLVAMRLGLFHLAFGALAVLNGVFYIRLGGRFGQVALILWFLAVLLWAMMALYHGPLLIAQESGLFDTPEKRAKRGAKAVIRRSFFLVLGEPLYSLCVLPAVLIWGALALMSAAGAALLLLGTLCVLTTVATRALLLRYEVLPRSDDASSKEM